MYAWNEDLLPVGAKTNRPGELFKPQGIVVHSTGNRRPGASAAMHRQYFGSAYRGASAHAFIDWDQALRIIPDGLGRDPAEKAWHAGSTANARYLGYELCETEDEGLFKASYARMVWAVGDAVVHHNWRLSDVTSHRRISSTYPKETDHQDPDPYLQRWGKSWAVMLSDIADEISRRRGVPVVLPTGETIRGETRQGSTWVQIGNVWAPVRPWAEAMGRTVTWVSPEQGGPRVVIE